MSRRIKPHRVRGREVEEEYGADPDGRPVLRHRVVDTLGKMLRAGTITPEMHDAAKDFQASFIVANLDPLRALPIPSSRQVRSIRSTSSPACGRARRP